MPPASSRSLSQLPLTLPVSALHLISMPHLHDSSEYLWGRMWSLPSGPSPPLGAPVSWGFHQGLGDDPSCLLCLASMEATKPQESKRTILRSKNGYGCEVVATLLTVLFLLLALTLYELKVYTCTCEQQSMARALVFRNLPIPPERWRLHQELVAPMSAQGGRIFSVPERHIILNHSVLELSFWEGQPHTPWDIGSEEPSLGFYQRQVDWSVLVLHFSQSNGFSFHIHFPHCLPQARS